MTKQGDLIMKYFMTLVILVYLLASISPLYSSWLSYQHDPFHTGRTDYEGPFNPELNWFYDCNYMIQTSPVINESGTIFFGSSDISPLENIQNSLYSIAPGGQLYWSLPFPDRISSTCSIGTSGNLYFGCEDGNFYCVNQYGVIQWSYPTYDSIVASSVITPNETIYFGTILNGILYAVNPNGTLKWSYISGGEKGGILSSPCLSTDYGTVYFGNYDGKVYALSTNNGGLKWSKNLGQPIQSSPAIGYQGSIVIGCNDTKLYVLDMIQGNLKWLFKTGDKIQSSPAIDKNGDIYITSTDGNVYALSWDGRYLWRYSTGSTLLSNPIIDGAGKIYFGSTNKKLYALNSDGSFLWTFDTMKSIDYSSPSIDSQGNIYICSTDGRLYSIMQGINQVRMPFTQNSVKNKLSSYLMTNNVGSSKVDFSIELYNNKGQKVNGLTTGSVQPGQLGIFAMPSIAPDFIGSCSIKWIDGKLALWSVIFNSEYGTGYPLSTNFGSNNPPVYFPYWESNPTANINTYIMANNTSIDSNLFLKVNMYDSEGNIQNPMSVNVPANGLEIIDTKSFNNQGSGHGFIEWLSGRGSFSLFGVVYNLNTNKGYPIDFNALYNSPVIIPFWQVTPSNSINTKLYIVNPFGITVDVNLDLYSFDGSLIDSTEHTIESGQQNLITLSMQENAGWAVLSWTDVEQLGATCLLENSKELSITPVSLNKKINTTAYIPFWQIYNSLSIDTYFILTNFDQESSATPIISFFNSSGQNLETIDMTNDPILPGSTKFLTAKSLFGQDNMGYAVINSNEENLAIWVYAYNGQFNVGYTIEPQYPIGSDN